MGQSLKKLAPGSEENKAKEIGPVIENCYNTYFAGTDKHVHRDWKSDDFYHAVCETIEEINKTLGSTQFRVPKTTELEQVFKIHHKGEDKVTKEEFNNILQDLVFKTRFSGFGAKDMLIYIFGVPMTTLFIKQKIIPKVIPNEIFIPVVTSATVFVLAKLNKI
ncbi:uncharacterized protein LOC114305920 [Camellia sinensis]|uniref:Uncharacterized protein n=1 Tax=Camellia sinensis var. sinensis TaxID=542762 RepID=A0A4S4DXX6_CAMSN|nr:uncharacterized protein LOC114305920 [Camellia sinensis]THG07715.1 hypothetical protein TEA_009664 [Camellia sinensis var. sinensis]